MDAALSESMIPAAEGAKIPYSAGPSSARDACSGGRRFSHGRANRRSFADGKNSEISTARQTRDQNESLSDTAARV